MCRLALANIGKNSMESNCGNFSLFIVLHFVLGFCVSFCLLDYYPLSLIPLINQRQMLI